MLACAVLTAAWPFLFGAAESPPSEPPAEGALDAAEILRRAEDVRNPDLDYALEIAIRSRSPEGKSPERTGTFTMVAHGKTRTMILRKTPPVLSDSVFMNVEGRHWVLMPRATRPLELTGGALLHGENAAGNLARMDFSTGWKATLVGEERLLDEPCAKLELTRTAGAGAYTRVLCWIARTGFLPLRLEYYGTKPERLVHMARYENYQEGSLGLRPMRMVIEGGNAWEDMSVVDFSNLRRVDASAIDFSGAGMLRFRDAATEGREPGSLSDITLEAVLGRLSTPSPAAPSQPPSAPQGK